MHIKKLRYAKYYAGVLFRNWRSKKDSFAQHGEDLLVEQLLPKVQSFIDIGANDGVLFSNTYKFAKSGARGLCLEPSAKCFWKLNLNHLPHLRVKCLKLAVSDRQKELFLEEAGYESVLSKVQPTYKKGLRKVKALSMLDLWSRYPAFRRTDLISIDVEGHEMEVLQGVGEEPLEAKIVIVESDKTNENEMLSLPCLRKHRVCFGNGVNLLLLHEKVHIEQINEIPEGFQRRS